MSHVAEEANSHVNPFVRQLVRLQQDGKEAISGPANWREPPLLEIPTDSEDDIDALIKSMSQSSGDAPNRGRWHWLIGSPGNGKSAKLGLIARRLMERGYEIVSEDGVAVGESDPDWLPYLLEVRERGQRYRFAYLVQDASVVRDPFGTVCDPAQDLADVLKLATAQGTSLLLCTNWGVLQRLFDMGHTDPTTREERWFRAVSNSLSKERPKVTIYPAGGNLRNKLVFDELEVTYEILDNRSLLVNSNLFERLFEKATEQQRWNACNGCPSISLCPMKANRDDLTQHSLRSNVLHILRRAEVLDGQIIVFREAVALLSLLLAGCPNDHGTRTPCDWVHDQIGNNRIFNLLARRIPSLLFSATNPHGLERPRQHGQLAPSCRREQLAALQTIIPLLEHQPVVRDAVAAVTAPRDLSRDVGLERLLGPGGAIPVLDPSLEPRHVVKLDQFIAAAKSHRSIDRSGEPTPPSGIGAIEARCLQAWEVVFDAIAETGDPVSGQAQYFWLRRWQASCLAWMASVESGLTALQPELESYLAFLSTSGERTELLSKMRDLEEVLASLLAPETLTVGDGVHVELAKSLWLSGSWTGREIKPRLQHHGHRASNTLLVKLGQTHEFIVTAETFIWLSRRLALNLSSVSFNPEILEALRRTQAQAAATSEYSRQDEDVTIVIIDEERTEHRISRMQGYILPPERS